LVVIGGMLLMAGVALVFALNTVDFRRSHDRPKETPLVTPVKAVRPAELTALGYLPADTDMIAAVHFAEALDLLAGRRLLDRLPGSPTGLVLDSLTKDTGLTRDDIDHAVLGLKVQGRLVPRVTLVVQTRRPYDVERLRKGLRSSKRTDLPQRVLYHFALERPPVEAVFWCAGPETLVVGLSKEDLQAVPLEPAAGVERFGPELQGLFKERLGTAQLWAVGHANDWNQTAARLALAYLSPEERQTLTLVRSFGVWLQLGETIVWNAALDCGDADAARAVDGTLTRWLTDGEGLRKLLGPDAAPVVSGAGRDLKHDQSGAWVTLQAKAAL
jgi:hypothetical protein